MLNFGLPGGVIHSKTTTKSVGLSYSYRSANGLIDLTAILWAIEVDTSSGVIRLQLGGTDEISHRTFGGDIANASRLATGPVCGP